MLFNPTPILVSSVLLNCFCYNERITVLQFFSHKLAIINNILPFQKWYELETKTFVECIVARNGHRKHQKAEKQDNCLAHRWGNFS